MYALIFLDIFDQIAQDLRDAVPPTAVFPGEEQNFHPSQQKVGTVVVDSHLSGQTECSVDKVFIMWGQRSWS